MPYINICAKKKKELHSLAYSLNLMNQSAQVFVVSINYPRTSCSTAATIKFDITIGANRFARTIFFWRARAFIWGHVLRKSMHHQGLQTVPCLQRIFYTSWRWDMSSIVCSWWHWLFSIFQTRVSLLQQRSWAWDLIIRLVSILQIRIWRLYMQGDSKLVIKNEGNLC